MLPTSAHVRWGNSLWHKMHRVDMPMRASLLCSDHFPAKLDESNRAANPV